MALQVTSCLWGEAVNDRAVQPSDFSVSTSSLDPDSLPDGAALVKLLYISVDPYLRGGMRDITSYYFMDAFRAGQPLESDCIAQVVASKAPALAQGDVVSGLLPWSTYAVLDAEALGSAQKLDASQFGKVPLSYFLGTLGMTGMTAYCSLKRIAEPKAGEVAFVTGAAGAVGLVAVQLLKLWGLTVIASAGSDDKVALLERLGARAFNYKTTNTGEALARLAPEGLDVIFENVGGETLEAGIEHCKLHARIVVCGCVSQYNLPDERKYGVRNLFNLVTKRIRMEGFIVSDYMADMGAEFAAAVGGYVARGELQVPETVTRGIEAAGVAFCDMMSGKNIGKAVVQVADDPFPVAP